MDIHLHNTLTGKKELFTPLKKTLFGRPKVGMYHCGPTVYNYIHIGNLRAFFLADTTRRMFEFHGYKVKQIMNITDVGLLESDNAEDKMTLALKREGKPLTLEAMRELADFYTKAFIKDLVSLNINIPHKLPKASEHIIEDITVIKKLEKKGLTYIIGDGVYFDTSKTNDYGKLGGVPNLDNEQTRIGLNTEKKNPRDFALWKFNSELGWQSPWGKGFPGWHIECSAMSMKYLGESFDIHTGGIDLIPIHHNNEIAQSEHATDHPFAMYWLHNAFVNVGEAKMAKSAGNYITLNTLIEKGYSPLEYRYFLLGARYSTPLSFSFEALDAAKNAYKKLLQHVSQLPSGGTSDKEFVNKSLAYMSDDLDTPKTLALVWDILKDESLKPETKKATIISIDNLLGLQLSQACVESDKTHAQDVLPSAIGELAEKRNQARVAKDWKTSDSLRLELESRGYSVKDTPTGQKLIKK